MNELDSVFLYDIDDLGKVVDDNMQGRIETAKNAEEIVREEVDRMVLRLKTREAAPAIVMLQDQFETWRKGEIERQRQKLGALTPQQEEAIEAITRGLMNKFAHRPIISQLKRPKGDE